MHIAVARVLTSISEPGAMGPLRAVPMRRLMVVIESQVGETEAPERAGVCVGSRPNSASFCSPSKAHTRGYRENRWGRGELRKEESTHDK